MAEELNSEDAKLVTLARGARARVQAAEGAALRDETGRTYSATNVDLPNVTLTALQLATAIAVSSGSTGVEAAVVVAADGFLPPAGLAALSDLGGGAVTVYACGKDGAVLRTTTSGSLD